MVTGSRYEIRDTRYEIRDTTRSNPADTLPTLRCLGLGEGEGKLSRGAREGGAMGSINLVAFDVKYGF